MSPSNFISKSNRHKYWSIISLHLVVIRERTVIFFSENIRSFWSFSSFCEIIDIFEHSVDNRLKTGELYW